MPKFEERKYAKYKVCKNQYPRDCKSFESLEDLVEWAKEEIKENNKIKVGDTVTIENYGNMYSFLDVNFFQELWENSSIGGDDIYKIMIHYDFGCDYGTRHNPRPEKARVKWKVLFIYGQRVFIERITGYIDSNRGQILCVGEDGLKKYEEDE